MSEKITNKNKIKMSFAAVVINTFRVDMSRRY